MAKETAKQGRRPSDQARASSSTRQAPTRGGETQQRVDKRQLLMAIPCVAIAAAFHFLSPNVHDLDSFFYIRLARIYRAGGLLDVEFPWLPYSAR